MTTPTTDTEFSWKRRFPTITVSHERCTIPFACKRCLQVCPQAVFYVVDAKGRQERLKEMDPRVDGNYVLHAPFVNKCTMCNRCIDVCPADAIKIKMPG